MDREVFNKLIYRISSKTIEMDYPTLEQFEFVGKKLARLPLDDSIWFMDEYMKDMNEFIDKLWEEFKDV